MTSEAFKAKKTKITNIHEMVINYHSPECYGEVVVGSTRKKEIWHLPATNENLAFETEHYIDEETRQVFEGLLNNSITHWRDSDIEYFLATEGRLMSRKIVLPQYKDGLKEILNFTFKNEDVQKIKKIIFCIYGKMGIGEFDKMARSMADGLLDKIEVFVGYIPDLTPEKDGICIHIIAIVDL
jgi:hypothetical protein